MTEKRLTMMEAGIRGCPYAVLTELVVQDEACLLMWLLKRIGIRARLSRADLFHIVPP